MTNLCPKCSHGVPEEWCGECHAGKTWYVLKGQYLCLYGGHWSKVIVDGGTLQLCDGATVDVRELHNGGQIAPADSAPSGFGVPVAIYVQRRAYRP